MKRIRKLGVVAIMVLASSAVASTGSAMAAGFEAAEYPAVVEISNTTNMTITSGPLSTSCSDPSADLGSFQSPGESISASANNGNYKCSGKFLTNSTFEMNKCLFIYHPATTGKGWFDLGPSGCGSATLNAETGCDYSFGPITNRTATYTNNTEGSTSYVKVSASFSLPYTKGGSGCSGSGSLAFNANWQLKALNYGGAYIDLWVGKDGFFFNKGLFEAEAYPLTVSGVQAEAKKHVLTMGPNSVKCTGVTFDAIELAGASSQLEVYPEYSGCSVTKLGVVFPAEIYNEGCRYVLNGAGTMDIGCEEGITTEVFVLSPDSSVVLCRYEVASQSGLGSAGYTTSGEGSNRGVAVDLNLKGLAFTVAPGKEALCGKTGATGSYTGATTLYGPSS